MLSYASAQSFSLKCEKCFLLCYAGAIVHYTVRKSTMQSQFLERTKIVKKPTIIISNETRMGRINIDHFIVGKSVRFLFTSWEESRTKERVFERARQGHRTGHSLKKNINSRVDHAQLAWNG